MNKLCSSQLHDVILFGAGIRLHNLFSSGYFADYHILAIVDNDPAKYGRCPIAGAINIVPPTEIQNYDGQYDGVLITVSLGKICLDIVRQLLDINVPQDKIYLCSGNGPLPLPHIIGVLHDHDFGRLYYDVTDITFWDNGTGIQRVINNLYLNLHHLKENTIIPVRYFGQYITSYVYHCHLTGQKCTNIEYAIRFNENDKLLFPQVMSDVSMQMDAVRLARTFGVKTYTIVHDLLALSRFAQNIFVKSHIMLVQKYVHDVLLQIDNWICVSKATADDVINYCRKHDIHPATPIHVFWFHLGADFTEKLSSSRAEMRSFVKRRPTFLMVGTVEARKNHALVLKALRKLLVQRHEVQILIIGHDGWLNDEFKGIYEDPGLSDYVLWIKDADDGELQWAYQNAIALLFPSMAEGFGLPLIEAAHYGLPVLCSDIPVFREIAGDGASYFEVNDVDALAVAISDFLQEEIHPDPRNIQALTWQESSLSLLNILEGKIKPYYILR